MLIISRHGNYKTNPGEYFSFIMILERLRAISFFPPDKFNNHLADVSTRSVDHYSSLKLIGNVDPLFSGTV